MLLNRRISILYFINEVKWQLLLVCLFSITVGITHVHPILEDFSIPLGLLAVVGTVVALLLAFRTSQSYERWWDARIIWGAIVNDSRTLIRDMAQFLPEDQQAELKIFSERQIIWTYALGESLRKLPFTPKVQAYLNEHQISGDNIPNALLEQHSAQIKRLAAAGYLSEFTRVRLSEIVSRLCDSMGKCERIKNTVFPKSYSVLLHTLIYAFTAMMPFALDHAHFLIEIAMCIIVPVMFISIEKTAIIMQDPFENTPVDTPMTALAQTIEINIRQAIGDTRLPEKPSNGLYYEM